MISLPYSFDKNSVQAEPNYLHGLQTVERLLINENNIRCSKGLEHVKQIGHELFLIGNLKHFMYFDSKGRHLGDKRISLSD